MHDPYASKTEVNCSGAASDQDTAFRKAEKQYQLHLEQVVKNSKGRKRRVKHVPRPTDLSQVLDIRRLDKDAAPAAGVQLVCLPALSPGLCSPGSSSSSNGHDTRSADISNDQCTTMLLFKAHPGLSVFPAALPTTWQLQLMQSALVEWPDPPARTNHTTAYGEQLHGLFRAAQEDLSLQHQQQKDPPSACQQQQQPETHCGMLSGGAALATMQQAPAAHQQLGAASVQQEHLHRQADDLDQEQAAAELISKLSHCCCCCCCCCCQQQAVAASTTTKGQLGTSWSSSSSSHGRDSICRCGEQQPPGIKQALGHLSSSASCPPAASSATPTDRWSVRGAGPSAALLLRKLRWVCLGPPYNWTDRVYEPHLIHRPLPDSLVRLARQFAAWAANWCNTPVGAAAAASVPPAADHQAAGVSPTAAGNVMLAAMAAAEQPASGTYMPDAALVNYYHAGDTLNGHADDVEPDLSQPIVTISLGCPAVFLMGGLSKDVAPTAMLLRSGDVVVLSGEARRCYHGLPRVLDDQDLPDDVVAAGQQQQETFGAILEHMRHCRINISVRAVH